MSFKRTILHGVFSIVTLQVYINGGMPGQVPVLDIKPLKPLFFDGLADELLKQNDVKRRSADFKRSLDAQLRVIALELILIRVLNLQFITYLRYFPNTAATSFS